MSQAENEYNVELLKAIKKVAADNKRCGIKVLIKWEGYEESENTWEPIENLNPVSAVRMLKDLAKEFEGLPKFKKLVHEAIHVWYRLSDPGDVQEPNFDRLISPPTEEEPVKKKVKQKTLADKSRSRPKPPRERRAERNLSRTSRERSESSEAPLPSQVLPSESPTPVHTVRRNPATPSQLAQPEEDEFVIAKKKNVVEYSNLVYDSSANVFKVTRSDVDPVTKTLVGTQSIDVVQEFSSDKVSQKALFSFVLHHFAEREKELERIHRRIYEYYSAKKAK